MSALSRGKGILVEVDWNWVEPLGEIRSLELPIIIFFLAIHTDSTHFHTIVINTTVTHRS